MPKPTAGWDLKMGASTIGTVLEFEDSRDGDTEDISGLNDTVGGIVRRKGQPVDVGAQITFSGKVDTSAAGWTSFRTAMRARTADTALTFTDGTTTVVYTGHSESYSESASRSNAVWDFNCTFYVNSEA